MNADSAIAARIAALRAAAVAARHRRLLLLAGGDAWLAHVVALAATQLPGLAHASGHFRGQLGGEHGSLLFDARPGFDADAFGALAGTLRAGSLLLLLTPPLAAWPALPDAALARWLTAPATPADAAGRYLARLVGLLRADPDVLRLEQGAALPAAPALPARAAPPAPADADGCRGPDQRRAVDAVLAVATTRTPVVLSADRGRGKSAALGLAAKRLLAEGATRLAVTAPRRAATAALYAQVPPGLHAGLPFFAPDALLQSPQVADLLLVDEAAGLPLAVLDGLLARYPACAFATTVHGYEGTGRGFAVRFRDTLDARAAGWREVPLQHPVRWAAGDPLERLTMRALLLDCEPDAAQGLGDAAGCRIERADRDRLAGDAARLDAVCGLLVQAHYRTTPNDLRLLLDAPGVGLTLALAGARVAAVAVTVDEGRLDDAAAFAAWAGTRRLRGHLVAQSLATHAGLVNAPRAAYRRVQRLAVHPALRRRGLGRRLVAALAADARADGCDLLATSFGASPELVDFWNRCGLRPARVGFRREASSGAHAVVALQPLSAFGTGLAETAWQRFARDLPALLGGPLGDLPQALVRRFGANPPSAGDPRADRHDRAEAAAFAWGRRGPDAALPALQRLLAETAPAAGEQAALRALRARCERHSGWAELAQQLGVPGRAAVVELMRHALRPLLQALATGDPALAALLRRLDGAG